MRKLLLLVVLFGSFIASGQEVEKVKFADLQKKILTADAPLTIFNFWATWCGPCIREMPHFEAYETNDDVKVYFVSLDFPNQFDKVVQFLEKKGFKTEALWLDETDAEAYKPKVSKDWSGAIPATLFVAESGKTYFQENEFSKDKLDNQIKEYLN